MLNQCRIFLGGKSDVHFITPGATHHARWMSKAIYCLKDQDHFRLTVAEKKGTTSISLFVIIIYGHYSFIHSFIHSGHFYSAPSRPLQLRGAPDYSTDTVSEFHAEAHRQLQVNDLPKVPT